MRVGKIIIIIIIIIKQHCYSRQQLNKYDSPKQIIRSTRVTVWTMKYDFKVQLRQIFNHIHIQATSK